MRLFFFLLGALLPVILIPHELLDFPIQMAGICVNLFCKVTGLPAAETWLISLIALSVVAGVACQRASQRPLWKAFWLGAACLVACLYPFWTLNGAALCSSCGTGNRFARNTVAWVGWSWGVLAARLCGAVRSKMNQPDRSRLAFDLGSETA